MSEIQIIPLAKLKPDKAGNVRKTGGKNIEELAASIRANGLLQNLGVVPSGKRYGVVFGGRRLRALQLLHKEGALPESLAGGIPCRVLAEAEAQETSLAENTVREAMHPLDQFQAFQTLVDEGKGVAEVSARFGVTELFVRQRMRLARVSPKLLKIYGAGEMSLEQLQAFAARRAAIAKGFRRGLTYILASEDGGSLRASGWRYLWAVKGRSWDTPTRRREDKHPTEDKHAYGWGAWPDAALAAQQGGRSDD